MVTTKDSVSVCVVFAIIDIWFFDFSPDRVLAETGLEYGETPPSKKIFIKVIFVYDILGNRIAELINEELNRGEYSITWNSIDNNNGTIDTGIHFIIFNIEDHFRTFKVIKH